MQTKNPLFDDIAKLANSAVGVAQGVGEEAKTFFQSQFERLTLDMDLVRREDLDVVLDRLLKAEKKIAELEALIAKSENPSNEGLDAKEETK